MGDFVVLTKRYTIYTLILIALFICLAFSTQFQAIFLGLALGSVFSLSNLLSTYLQVKRLGDSVEKGRAKGTLGTVFRFSLGIIAVYISSQYPELFDLISVVVGLMLTYIIIFINSLFQLKHI